MDMGIGHTYILSLVSSSLCSEDLFARLEYAGSRIEKVGVSGVIVALDMLLNHKCLSLLEAKVDFAAG